MEKVIGLIYRFDKNDYQISIMDFEEHDQKVLMELMEKYDYNCSCERGDSNLTIDKANVWHWEGVWAKQEMDIKRRQVAHEVGKVIENDLNFYDDHEGTHWTEDDVYESLGNAKDSAYSIETLIQFYDGSEETKKYYDAAMEIIHFMEWYQKGEN